MRYFTPTFAALALASTAFGQSANTPVSENCNGSNTSYAASGTIAGTPFTIGTVVSGSGSGNDLGARILSNALVLTSDASADGDDDPAGAGTSNSDGNGNVFAYLDVDNIDNTYYKKRLDQVASTNRIEWSFNMRLGTTATGFADGNIGAAVILAGSTTTPRNSGLGYAIVIDGENRVKLVSYNGGVVNPTSIINSNDRAGQPATDNYNEAVGTQYLSVKVTFVRSTNTWNLFVRKDGTTAFADPATIDNSYLISNSNVTNTSYISNTNLDYYGAFFNGRDNGDAATFDNFTTKVVSTLSATPLPVTLTYFKGNMQDNTADLTWQTSEEKNFSHYTVERSTDGKAYAALNDIKAKGANSTYHFSDNLAGVEAATVYYRLKAVDADGTADYSSVVRLNKAAAGLGEVAAYPNPFQTGISVQVNTAEEQLVTLELYSLDGRLVITKAENLNRGSNVVSLNGLNDLASGMYILNVHSGNDVKSIRLVK
jgi:hypothetical protein